jgi:hypothetical protein
MKWQRIGYPSAKVYKIKTKKVSVERRWDVRHEK